MEMLCMAQGEPGETARRRVSGTYHVASNWPLPRDSRVRAVLQIKLGSRSDFWGTTFLPTYIYNPVLQLRTSAHLPSHKPNFLSRQPQTTQLSKCLVNAPPVALPAALPFLAELPPTLPTSSRADQQPPTRPPMLPLPQPLLPLLSLPVVVVCSATLRAQLRK